MPTSTVHRRMRKEERRAHLIQAARHMFASKGFDATSMDDIAHEAGITKPILYKHFESKHAMYIAVLEEHLSDLIGRLWVALSTDPDPRERLRAGFEAYFEFVEQRPDGFKMIVDAGTRIDPHDRQHLEKAWDTLADGIARTVGDLLRAADLDPSGAPIYARALIGMVEAVAGWWLRTQRITRDMAVAHMLALAWRGFDGLPRHPLAHVHGA